MWSYERSYFHCRTYPESCVPSTATTMAVTPTRLPNAVPCVHDDDRTTMRWHTAAATPSRACSDNNGAATRRVPCGSGGMCALSNDYSGDGNGTTQPPSPLPHTPPTTTTAKGAATGGALLPPSAPRTLDDGSGSDQATHLPCGPCRVHPR